MIVIKRILKVVSPPKNIYYMRMVEFQQVKLQIVSFKNCKWNVVSLSIVACLMVPLKKVHLPSSSGFSGSTNHIFGHDFLPKLGEQNCSWGNCNLIVQVPGRVPPATRHKEYFPSFHDASVQFVSQLGLQNLPWSFHHQWWIIWW